MGDLEQTPDIATLWAEVMAWLRQHAPVTAAALHGNGSSRDIVDTAARDTGLDWPDDLRVWFTLHDGGGDELLPGGQLFPMFSPDELVESRFNRDQAVALGRQLMETVGPGLVGDDGTSLAGQDVAVFLPEFIPVATDPGQGHLVVDLRPGPMHGCVTTFTYESGTAYGTHADEGPSWPSLTALLSDVRDALVEGAPFLECTAQVVGGALWWAMDGMEVYLARDEDDDAEVDAPFDPGPPVDTAVTFAGQGGWPVDAEMRVAGLPPAPPGWEGEWPPADWDLSIAVADLDDGWDGRGRPPGFPGPWPPEGASFGLVRMQPHEPWTEIPDELWRRQFPDKHVTSADGTSASMWMSRMRPEVADGDIDLPVVPAPDFSEVPDVTTVWSQLLAWIDENAPATGQQIVRRGAGFQQVAAAEALTGIEWTDELRTWFTLQSGVMMSTGDSLLFAWDIDDLDAAMSSRAVNQQVAAEDDELSTDERDFRTRMARTQAGSRVLWHRAFVPICDSHTGVELVVDLRPGPRRGCVLTHNWEDGGVGMGYADAWPSIAAMLWEHLEVMRTGDPGRIGAVVRVTDQGYLEWVYD